MSAAMRLPRAPGTVRHCSCDSRIVHRQSSSRFRRTTDAHANNSYRPGCKSTVRTSMPPEAGGDATTGHAFPQLGLEEAAIHAPAPQEVQSMSWHPTSNRSVAAPARCVSNVTVPDHPLSASALRVPSFAANTSPLTLDRRSRRLGWRTGQGRDGDTRKNDLAQVHRVATTPRIVRASDRCCRRSVRPGRPAGSARSGRGSSAAFRRQNGRGGRL